MLFDRNITPRCEYCHHGTDLGRGRIICIKRGIMAVFGSCGAFRYEPTKRTPEAIPSVKKSTLPEEDFYL